MNTITIAPTGKGQVIATSSDGHTMRTATPLLDGARYWLGKGANPDTPIITVWSSFDGAQDEAFDGAQDEAGKAPWSLRSTIGQAAKLIVETNTSGTPAFKRASKV
jgi:hypothetical protein